MKQLTTPAGRFGPFTTIETIEDRYRCDNTDLPFTVVGQGEIVDADTIQWPAPPAPPVPVPASVTMRQARLALHAAGLLAGVNAAIASMPEPAKTAALIEWEYSSEVWRDKPFVQQLGATLGLDSQALDDLFIAAAKV